MTTEDITAIRSKARATAEKATPGVWEVETAMVGFPDAEANAAHIAMMCPANTLSLLDHIDHLERENERLSEVIDVLVELRLFREAREKGNQS